MKLSYLYDAQGVFLGQCEARLSPARPQNPDGSPNYLQPANTTDAMPPLVGNGQVPVFDGEAWRVVEDHRGQVAYATADGQPMTILAVGPLPEGATLTPPPSRRHTWDAATASWQPDMAAIQADAEAAIDAQADALLAPYISLTPGRAMTYLAKEAQARQFLAAENPDPADYPLIAGEVGITADTAKAVAETILDMAQAWHSMGAAIEAVRLTAKKQVRQAQTPEAVQAVLNAIVWPKEQAA
ncbi:putative tail fiber assembly protein [Desulfovibrio sp. DV]|uniref:hypothetical protein n=1 Tax=Desulfovibrio sp. DV TaxID=1844708 RepID=UPI00094B951D|nr:hypothetical protein [Desulfovibrio sp. DV]OLN24852.1 putative tail fiber assembly protein [Desulfovibrio sp. DV]